MVSFEITILSIIFMIFLGYFTKKIGFLKSTDVKILNKIVINIAMPCLIFNALYNADLSMLSTLSILPCIGIITSLILGSILYMVLTYKSVEVKKKWSIILIVILGNTGFLGYPLVSSFFGSLGLVRAIFFDVNTTFMVLISSFVLMLVFGGKVKNIIKRVFLFPMLWAVIIGILVNLSNIQIGDFLSTILSYFSALTIPLIMISLGLSLSLRGLNYHFKLISLTSILKLIVYPAIALIFINLFGLTGLDYNVALIEAAMPSALLSLAIGTDYDLDLQLISDCVLVNILFSLVTIPLIISFL